MRKLTPLFIPLCGIFGIIAGYFLWGGGTMTILGLGVGLVIGVIFRAYVANRPK